MRIHCDNYEDADRLSRLYGETHIERAKHGCWLVVDRVRKMAVA